jgi:4-amino-4-deoxy-L-arabinose transferase-like glycosyltransferase
MAGVVAFLLVGTAVWVFFDAPERSLTRWWSLGVVALWAVAFPWYLVNRTKEPLRPRLSLVSRRVGIPILSARRARTRWFDGQRWTDAVQS